MWLNVLAPVLSLLPERWRRALVGDAPLNWPRAAFISGLVEGLGCLGGLIAWYLFYIRVAVGEQAQVTSDALQRTAPPAGATDVGLSIAMGMAALTSFVMHPVSWVLAYFALEGMLRTLAALATDETVGTLPLVLIDRGIARGQRGAYELRVPLVADEVTRGDEKTPWALRVASCRPKPHWKYPLTIRYNDEFFQVAGEAAAGGTRARPHVYLFRRPPAGEAYRGVEHYDPEGILRAEEREPNFLVSFFRAQAEQYRLARLPLVRDVVERGDGSKGWHLRVESCRPKPQWTRGRTIRYEDLLFRVESSFPASPARPFGYQLRLLSEAEAARGPLDYSPDEPLRQAKK